MTDAAVRTTAFSVTITAVTQVDATVEEVWSVLTDTEAYPQWNPLVRRLEGELAPGSRITVDLQPDADKGVRTLRPRIVDLQPSRSFTWLGRIGVPGLLDGRHSFCVEASGTGARLTQHELLSGALVPLFRSLLTTDTPRAFVACNDALAARVRA